MTGLLWTMAIGVLIVVVIFFALGRVWRILAWGLGGLLLFGLAFWLFQVLTG